MSSSEDCGGSHSMAEMLAQLKVMHESISEVKKDIRGIYTNQNEVLKALSGFASRQKTAERDIDTLARIVRDGNGQPSLVHRLSAIETKLEDQQGEITKLCEYYNAIASARVLSRGQVIAGITGMLITAILSAVSIIVAVFN